MSNATKHVPGSFAVPVSAPPAPVSAWAPLAVPIFRALWIAYLISLIGTWAREAGAPWLMTLLTTGRHDQAFWVSLIQTAGNLPIALLSIAAGVLADIYDRRLLLILTNAYMLVVSALLGVMTLSGAATPQMLLTFTLLLGIGAAMSGPAFQYVIPELVPSQQLPLAIALNSVALNVARAVGPALGMVVLYGVGRWLNNTARGAGASFLVNAAAFIGVVWVLIRWHRGEQKKPAHRETLWGATRIAFRYTAHSPALRAILIRVAAFILCAVIVWAQLAIVAKKQLGGGEETFGILMAAVGLGAVIGVSFMPKMDRRFSTDGMVALCTAIFGLALIGLSQCRGRSTGTFITAGTLSMIIGFNWVIVPTNFNIATQRSVPNWVKGRAIAMYMTVLFGSFAVGSPIWGALASAVGISNASLIAGLLILAGLLLVKPFPLTRARGLDFAPAGRTATPPDDFVPGAGAVQVCTEYRVEAARQQEFEKFLRHELRRQHLRNGAAGWSVERREEPEGHALFCETVTFANWHDRLRAVSRLTRADAALQDRAASFHVGSAGPAMRLIGSRTAEAPEPTPQPVPLPWQPRPMIRWHEVFERISEESDAIYNRIVRTRFK